MPEFNLIQLPKFLDDSLSAASHSIGRTLDNIFYAVFSIINYPIEEMRIRHALSLQKYEQDIKCELNKIPEEKLIEPPLNIVGPALEASKYYIEDENMRKMFAKLIASSMNIDYSGIVRTTFIEVIKQMEPLDAKVFESLAKAKHYGVGQIRYSNKEGGITLYEVLFPFEFLDISNMDKIAASVNNIIRLGLIKVSESSSFIDKSKYEPLKTHPVYLHFQEAYINVEEEAGEEKKTVSLAEMYWSMSPLGSHFEMTCIS